MKDYHKLLAEMPKIARAVNAFSSEAIQQSVFKVLIEAAGVQASSAQSEDAPSAGAAAKRKRTAKKAGARRNDPPTEGGKEKPTRKRVGAATILRQLIDEGFFKTPQNIGTITEHCRVNKAKTLKANELSGPLGRFTRSGELTREKNADGLYEYTAT